MSDSALSADRQTLNVFVTVKVLTAPVWLEFGMKAEFRVLTTNEYEKVPVVFAKQKLDKGGKVCPYLPANMAYRRCSYDFNSIPTVEIS